MQVVSTAITSNFAPKTSSRRRDLQAKAVQRPFVYRSTRISALTALGGGPSGRAKIVCLLTSSNSIFYHMSCESSGYESFLGSKSPELLDAMLRTIVRHVANVKIPLGIDSDSMGPIHFARYECPLFQ
jgi:hypothetical protein